MAITLTVVVRAMRLLAVGAVLALLHFEEVWVVLLLLPSVRVLALILIRAALVVGADKVVDFPVRTHFT